MATQGSGAPVGAQPGEVHAPMRPHGPCGARTEAASTRARTGFRVKPPAEAGPPESAPLPVVGPRAPASAPMGRRPLRHPTVVLEDHPAERPAEQEDGGP